MCVCVGVHINTWGGGGGFSSDGTHFFSLLFFLAKVNGRNFCGTNTSLLCLACLIEGLHIRVPVGSCVTTPPSCEGSVVDGKYIGPTLGRPPSAVLFLLSPGRRGSAPEGWRPRGLDFAKKGGRGEGGKKVSFSPNCCKNGLRRGV